MPGSMIPWLHDCALLIVVALKNKVATWLNKELCWFQLTEWIRYVIAVCPPVLPTTLALLARSRSIVLVRLRWRGNI